MQDQTEDRQPPAQPYRTFLVRLWREESASAWRASAQSVQSGEVVRFASPEELFAFLWAQTLEEADNE
ncbi:MAG: hypothetical protein AAF702_16005 [Chloroflexota bacterium]